MHCTKIMFKQIFSTFIRILSVQQLPETNVFPRTNQSDRTITVFSFAILFDRTR